MAPGLIVAVVVAAALAAVPAAAAMHPPPLRTDNATTAPTPPPTIPAAPKGGVWLFGVTAYSPITTLFAFAVDLTDSPSRIVTRTEVPLVFNSTLVPTSRSWAQDVVTGRLAMWHTISGGADAGKCAVETVRVQPSPTHPRLESTWVVPSKYCVKGAQITLDPRAPSTVYLFARVPSLGAASGDSATGRTYPVLLKITGPGSGTGAARVSVISDRIPVSVYGPIAIDAYFHDAYIVNTSLLVPTQNVIKVSTISGDVTVDSRPIVTDTTRLSAVQFSNKKMGQAYASANYNSQSGRMARVDTSASPWRVTKLGYAPSPYTFRYDFSSDPPTAYGGGPSWCNWYHVTDSNPPLRSIVIQGYWNYGVVFPYTMR